MEQLVLTPVINKPVENKITATGLGGQQKKLKSGKELIGTTIVFNDPGIKHAFDFTNADLETSSGVETTTKYIKVKDSAGAEYYVKIYSVA